jgi:ElaB/YqjD/DUF883 family membrane-anchored ribosome-binding protein
MEYAQMDKAPSNVQEMPGQEGRLQNVRQQMDQYMATATEKAREYYTLADRQVQSNPWTAVGVGFGVGMIFGALIAMASRSQHTALDHFR